MLARGRLKMYNWRMRNFYICKREKHLSMEERCISGYLLLFKSPSNLFVLLVGYFCWTYWCQWQAPGFTWPAQFNHSLALQTCQEKRLSYSVMCSTFLPWPCLRSDEKYFLYRCSIHKWGLTLCSKPRLHFFFQDSRLGDTSRHVQDVVDR